MKTFRLTLALGLVAAATASFAAQPGGVTLDRSAQPESLQGWTDADYANARVLNPTVSHLPASVLDLNGAAAEAGQPLQGSSKGGKGGANAAHLSEKRMLLGNGNTVMDDGLVAPEAVGTGGIYFTSSQSGPSSIDTVYPYRTIGKLYFKIGALTYMCSGSMIKPGIVVTAGHCVHSGNGAASGWYTGFQFIPGYRKSGVFETRPYGTWTSWAQVRTSNAWFSGGGGVPNAGDFALIVFNKDRSGLNIGNYTGWLGYQYPSMIGRHQTVLGYPGNLDAGGIQHRVDSMVTNYGSFNNGTWGSDMEGGSSGGPVVKNFQMSYSNSSTVPSDNESNRVTSVVSWGYVSTTPKVQGGTQFDSVFGSMVTASCTAFPGAC